MNYLARIGKTFYLRLPVPKDLQQFFQCKEVKQSLHTSCRPDAKILLTKLVAEYQQQFFNMRYNPPMHQRPPTKLALDIFSKMYPGLPPEPRQVFNIFDRLITTWPLQLMSIMDALDAGYLPNQDGFLECSGLAPKAKPMFEQPAIQQPQVPAATTPTKTKPVLLTKAIAEYLKDIGTRQGAVVALESGTVDGYKLALTQFSKYAGTTCTVVDAATKINDYRDFRVDKGLNKVSMNTYLRAIKSFYVWCGEQDHKYIDAPPTIKACTFKPAELLTKGNKHYTDEDMPLMLEAFTQIEAKDLGQRRRNLSFIYFCMTLLFSGFRKEELLVFECADFREIGNIPVLDLPPEKVALYKNLNAARVMPVHKKLLELHLADFVKSRNNTKLFDYSYAVYRTLFNQVLYSTKIKTVPYEKLFHSFRGGYDTSLNTVEDCKDSWRLMLLGHGKKGQDKNYLTIINQHVPAFNKSVQQMPFNYDFTKLKAFLRQELDALY